MLNSKHSRRISFRGLADALSKRFNLVQTAQEHLLLQSKRIFTGNLRFTSYLGGLAFQLSFGALILITHNQMH